MIAASVVVLELGLEGRPFLLTLVSLLERRGLYLKSSCAKEKTVATVGILVFSPLTTNGPYLSHHSYIANRK